MVVAFAALVSGVFSAAAQTLTNTPSAIASTAVGYFTDTYNAIMAVVLAVIGIGIVVNLVKRAFGGRRVRA